MHTQEVTGLAQRVETMELQSALQQLAGLLGAAWGAATSPFQVFGPDQALTNVLFIASLLLLAYNIVAQAPRQ